MLPDTRYNLLPHMCQCPGDRRPPFGLYGPTVEAIKAANILHSSSPFGSHRCAKCKQLVYYTVGQVMGVLRRSSAA